jgi:hypothetical protein
MAPYSPQPKPNRRPLLIGIGSSLAGLCVLCSCIGFFASRGDGTEERQRPAVPAAVTSATVATTAPATGAVTTPAGGAATTTPPAVVTTPPAVAVTTTVAPPPPPPAAETTDDQDVYYKNCTEARRAGAAPLRRGEPGYRAALDRDGDGVACES